MKYCNSFHLNFSGANALLTTETVSSDGAVHADSDEFEVTTICGVTKSTWGWQGPVCDSLTRTQTKTAALGTGMNSLLTFV